MDIKGKQNADIHLIWEMMGCNPRILKINFNDK